MAKPSGENFELRLTAQFRQTIFGRKLDFYQGRRCKAVNENLKILFYQTFSYQQINIGLFCQKKKLEIRQDFHFGGYKFGEN